MRTPLPALLSLCAKLNDLNLSNIFVKYVFTFIIRCCITNPICRLHQVKKNAKALGEYLTELGYEMVTGGTDNHLLLW
jgi:hypothetical protein